MDTLLGGPGILLKWWLVEEGDPRILSYSCDNNIDDDVMIALLELPL